MVVPVFATGAASARMLAIRTIAREERDSVVDALREDGICRVVGDDIEYPRELRVGVEDVVVTALEVEVDFGRVSATFRLALQEYLPVGGIAVYSVQQVAK